MKIKNKSYSIPLVILASLIALVAVLSTVTIYEGTTIRIPSDRNETYSLNMGLTDRSGTAFEDSDVFSQLFASEIYDITRMCVIKNQMETNGSFDADKKIDVIAYANRDKNTYSTQARANVAGNTDRDDESEGVQYRLDDLVKWGNYGFDLIPVTGTEAQLEAYYYSLINDVDMGDIATEESAEHVDAEDALWRLSENNVTQSSENIYTDYILVERYKGVDKKSIIAHVSNRREYKALIYDIARSSVDLFSNYNEYISYGDRYGDGKTNVLYCYQLRDASGKMVRYSNLKQAVGKMTNDELSKEFTSHTKYTCFNPDRLQVASNIDGVDAMEMKQAISSYEYAFGEGSRVWLALDENYAANDVFYNARNEYNKSTNALIPACIGLIASIVAYLAVLIIMTVLAGRVQVIEENGDKITTNRACRIDSVPIEIYIAVACVVLFLVGGGADILIEELSSVYRDIDGGMHVIFGVYAVVANIILLPIYLILVRKIKCKLMWNGSILKWIVSKVTGGVTELYDNGQIAVRVWLPYLLFLAFNLVLVLLGVGGIIVAFIADILIGIWLFKDAKVRNDIVAGITKISEGEINHKVDIKGMHGDNLALAGAVNSIGDGISRAVNTSMRDEKMKADLITNVSHDIKTPLTSIINYVDLLKRENIKDEKIKGYVDILDQKSQRLKQLTDDLVEASKISSGNISLNIERLNFVELIHQSVGEFSEKFDEKGLKTMLGLPAEPVYIMADSRGIYRVVENLYNNVYKYALEGTRVYVDMEVAYKDVSNPDSKESRVSLLVKNISAAPLNISASELLERFSRGDSSRKTEGSGLGLSIAKNLTEAMGGTFDISLDGDLFKAVIGFKLSE